MKLNLFQNRFLNAYLPVFIALALSFSMILTGLINEMKDMHMSDSNIQMLNYVMGYTQQSLANIDAAISIRANSDPDLMGYMESTNVDNQYMEYMTIKILEEFMLEYPLIHSMYLYRIEDNMVLTSNGKFTLEDFMDAPFLKETMNTDMDNIWSSTRQLKYWAYDPATDVVSMVIPNPRASYMRGAIVVNVGSEALIRNIKRMINDENTYLDIQNIDGRSVFQKPVVYKAEVKKPELQNEMQSTYNGWNFISGVYKKPVTKLLEGVSVIWTIMGLLIFLLGLIYIVFVSRSNYAPVQAIMESINGYYLKTLKKPGQKKNELSYIQTAITDLIETSSIFREQHEEDLEYRKKVMFLYLIGHSGISGNVDWKSELELFGIRQENQRMIAAIFEIDNYTGVIKQNPKSQNHIIKYMMQKGILDQCDKNQINYWGEWTSERRFTVVFFIKPDLDFQSLIQIMHQWLDQNVDFSITIGVGGEVTKPDDIHQSWHEASKCLELKAVLGNKRILEHSGIDGQKKMESRFKYMSSILDITRKIRVSDVTWQESYNSLVMDMSQAMHTREDIKSLFSYMYYNLKEIAAQMPIDIQDYWEEDITVILQERINSFETLEDISSVMVNAIQQLFVRMVELRSENDSVYKLNEIKTFIDKHYDDPQISLDMISDKFSINKTFLSRIFKVQYGRNFVDYLIEKRIERSVELLTKEKMNIDEIARVVGYSHYVSFSRSFKKVVGVTPGEFRQNLKSQ